MNNKKIANKYDCYIASGWFNPAQASDLENIKGVCRKLSLVFFSPKDEIVCPPDADATTQQKIFDGNLKAIMMCKFVIVNTRNKDLGTIFEAGASYVMEKPIIYYCEGLTGNFNLMLSRSGAAVATNLAELEHHLREIIKNPKYRKEYVGFIE